MKEYIVWGKSSKNPIHENILLDTYKNKNIHDYKIAQKLEKLLINQYGCFDTCIQEFDLNQPFDLQNALFKAINIQNIKHKEG